MQNALNINYIAEIKEKVQLYVLKMLQEVKINQTKGKY